MDVGEKPRDLGLGDYENKFRDNRIDAEVLSQLIVYDPKDIGGSAVGDRRKLIAPIAALVGTTSPIESQASLNKLAPRIGPHVLAERRPITVMLCDLDEDDCPQRRFLDEKGEGVFDICFEVPDATQLRPGVLPQVSRSRYAGPARMAAASPISTQPTRPQA
jgi:hypothetical protein